MRVLLFGTYDAERHPRVAVLGEGLGLLGAEVEECNVPLGLPTERRVAMLRNPGLLPHLASRLLISWTRLWRKARSMRRPDAVFVGYLGHFDVHLARSLWRGLPIVLDHLAPAAETAVDRGTSSRVLLRALRRLDELAVGAATLVCVDTVEHLELLPPEARQRALVVPVGASTAWFGEPKDLPTPPLRVIFFGAFTPLQGAPVIGEAVRRLSGSNHPVEFTMIGRGQDRDATERLAGRSERVRWLDWVENDRLPGIVAGHHVCLGIFGRTAKAGRVVPNKVFQGAAAGCAVVTSDTGPQRRALGDAAMFVPPDDPGSLEDALTRLLAEPDTLRALRGAARRRAEEAFHPERVAGGLHAALRRL